MTRQTDGKSLYEQQEERILAQSDAFISLLTKRGILGDHQIDNEKVRKAKQEKNRKSYHNTQLLLQHYRNIAITTHSCFFSIIEILPGCWSVCRWTLLQSWMSHLKVLTN